MRVKCRINGELCCGRRAVSYTHLDVYKRQLLGSRGQDALFNGFQKVCEPFLRIPELLFQNRQPGVLLLLGIHDQIYQPFDDFIAENHLNSSFHHEPFKRLFADGFQDVYKRQISGCSFMVECGILGLAQ